MKVAHNSYRLHAIKRERFSQNQIISLFTEPEHLYPGQRDHQASLKSRKHVQNALIGDSRRFSAAYVLDEKCLFGLDGYHRAAAVVANLAYFLSNQPPIVDTLVVQTMADAERLFAQFNSLAAAKKSTCWFTSGLRETGALKSVVSKLVWIRGKATAVQFAAGMIGPGHTKAATKAVIGGLLKVDSWKLVPHSHELAGTVGAYYAIALHCTDADLVETFVRNVNQAVFAPMKPAMADSFVTAYRAMLQSIPKTGGTPNAVAFQAGLHAFAQFAYAKRRKTLRVALDDMNLALFKQLMAAL